MKSIKQLSLLVPLLVTLAAQIHAQLIFVTNNGAITITGYSGSGGPAIIPDSINGYPVTSISPYAFHPYGTGEPSSVVIPNSVTNIGEGAFDSCTADSSTALTNVVMSTNMTALPLGVFGFSGLTSFNFPPGITDIGGSAFDNCYHLKNVIIPPGVQSIGAYAFNDCFSMTSVTIPDAVTNLGDWSYEGCFNMTNLIIGNGLTTIPANAFRDCVSLPTVSIPDSVTNIGSDYYVAAFSGCPALTNITYGSGIGLEIGNLRYSGTTNLMFLTVSSNNPVLSSRDGVLFDKTQTTLIQCPIAKTGPYSIPNTLTSVWGQAFLDCAHLTEVSLNSTIDYSGGSVCSGCTGITNVIILEGVTNIQPWLFFDCVNLKSITASPSNLVYCSVDGVLF